MKHSEFIKAASKAHKGARFVQGIVESARRARAAGGAIAPKAPVHPPAFSTGNMTSGVSLRNHPLMSSGSHHATGSPHQARLIRRQDRINFGNKGAPDNLAGVQTGDAPHALRGSFTPGRKAVLHDPSNPSDMLARARPQTRSSSVGYGQTPTRLGPSPVAGVTNSPAAAANSANPKTSEWLAANGPADSGRFSSALNWAKRNKFGIAATGGAYMLGGGRGYERGNQSGFDTGVSHGYNSGFGAAQMQAQNTPFMSRMMGNYAFDPSSGSQLLGSPEQMNQLRRGDRANNMINRRLNLPFT